MRMNREPIDRFKEYSHFSFLKYRLLFLLSGIFKKSTSIRNLKEKEVAKIRSRSPVFDNNDVFDIQRIDNLTEEEFKKFVKAGVPVIFNRAAIDWECTKKWSFDFLIEKYGEFEVDLVNRKGLLDERTEQIKNGDVAKLKVVLSDIKEGKESYYLRFTRIMEKYTEFQNDLDLNWLKKMRQCFAGVSYQSFIGAKGKRTPWHCGATAFFFIVASGIKEWNLYPSYMYPLMNPPGDGFGYFYSNIDSDGNSKFVKTYHCIIEPGDILFAPAWMWHKVENLEDTFGVSYRFVNIRGILREPIFSFLRTFFTNPSFFSVMKEAFSANPRKEYNITPKLFK